MNYIHIMSTENTILKFHALPFQLTPNIVLHLNTGLADKISNVLLCVLSQDLHESHHPLT